jgi:hypothetical protein
VKEEQQECKLDALYDEAVVIVRSVSLEQGMGLELAQIAAQLVLAVAPLREAEGSSPEPDREARHFCIDGCNVLAFR